ncbi:MAG: HAD-IB family phosphatase [Patescibacteria group bacterium]|jgi:phosphoserine phosphatase
MPSDIKLVCFDLDLTLISHNSWSDLNMALGVSADEDTRLYTEYKTGKITYEEWNALTLEKYLEHADATRDGVTKALSNYRYSDGAREAVRYLQEKGYIVVLISGSIDIIVNLIAKELGITYAKANNTFLFDEHDRLNGITTDGDDRISKARHLEAFCELLGVQMSECACIGDGENDLEMFRRTGKGITFAGSSIESEAWRTINSLHDIPKLFA